MHVWDDDCTMGDGINTSTSVPPTLPTTTWVRARSFVLMGKFERIRRHGCIVRGRRNARQPLCPLLGQSSMSVAVIIIYSTRNTVVVVIAAVLYNNIISLFLLNSLSISQQKPERENEEEKRNNGMHSRVIPFKPNKTDRFLPSIHQTTTACFLFSFIHVCFHVVMYYIITYPPYCNERVPR